MSPREGWPKLRQVGGEELMQDLTVAWNRAVVRWGEPIDLLIRGVGGEHLSPAAEAVPQGPLRMGTIAALSLWPLGDLKSMWAADDSATPLHLSPWHKAAVMGVFVQAAAECRDAMSLAADSVDGRLAGPAAAGRLSKIGAGLANALGCRHFLNSDRAAHWCRRFRERVAGHAAAPEWLAVVSRGPRSGSYKAANDKCFCN